MTVSVLSDDEDINRAWGIIKENNKTSATESLGRYELKRHKSCFDEECSRYLDKRKQTKIQWSQGPNRNTIYSI